MFYRTIFVCLVGLAVATSAEEDPPEIKFQISSSRVNNSNHLVCDHNVKDTKQQHTYTVREGEHFTLITKYNSFINRLICSNYKDNNSLYNYFNKKKNYLLNVTTFTVEKKMGDRWNCTILSHRDNPTLLPVVQYENATYSAAYCYLKIHVRQTKPPQTILVNNMVLQAVRADLSQKDVDFTAEYHYADGDVVDVTCANFLNQGQLTMVGTTRDISTMKGLSAQNAIGFRAKLGSGHNNSYMICTNTESTDYTKVMVTFVMRTESNFVSIKINGMTLRPKLTNELNNHYENEYKYLSNQLIIVLCEVQADMKLVVTDSIDFVGKVTGYNKTGNNLLLLKCSIDETPTWEDGAPYSGRDGNPPSDYFLAVELIPNKKAKMTFLLKPTDDKKLQCSSDYVNGTSAEQVGIHFTDGNFPIDRYPLHMELLPSNGTAMELYNDNGSYKLKVFFYEFEDGETLQLKCGPLFLPERSPVLYLQFKDSDICKSHNCTVSKTLHLTRKDENTKITCYLKEQIGTGGPSKEDDVLREITVILRERVLTTTSTTTTTTSTTTRSIELAAPDSKSVTLPAVISIVVLCIIIICVSIVIFKMRKRNHSQGGSHDRNYENLQSPSEASIPAYPPQLESNYAVPVDRRTEDTTYSVPCQEPALYSTPTPKNLRNKKQKPADPTYAVLEATTAGGRKNTFRETDNPNYSEVYASRQEECYAKVLPRSVRKKMPEDDHPYTYVRNEPAYVNTPEPEPTYCEPAKAQGGTYANLNNSHYANSHAQEYVEPTYSEPQKRMK